jgi:hypothetical protein
MLAADNGGSCLELAGCGRVLYSCSAGALYPTQTRRGEPKKAGVGARYVLVFQDGSRHPFNMVPGRKFTIGKIM